MFPISDFAIADLKQLFSSTAYKSEIGNRQLAMSWMAGQPRLLHQEKQLGRLLWSQAIPIWATL
jgi:hypothetical protein